MPCKVLRHRMISGEPDTADFEKITDRFPTAEPWLVRTGRSKKNYTYLYFRIDVEDYKAVLDQEQAADIKQANLERKLVAKKAEDERKKELAAVAAKLKVLQQPAKGE